MKMAKLPNLPFKPAWAASGWRVGVCLAGLALLGGCTSEKPKAPAQRPPVPVAMGQVTKKDMPLVVKAIGRAEAYATVSVTSRVSGQLLKVHFEQGDMVKEGQLLFTIDPAPYQAALDQAQANLQRDLAKLKEAEVDVRRYAGMVKRDFVSQQQYDEKVTEAAALRATVKADEAQTKTARLNLSYCTISSPITGRTGKLLVNAGNQIQAGGTNALVVINQVQPIFVSFSLPEKDLPLVRQYAGQEALLVEAKAPGQSGRTSMGHLAFIDNQVDESTGTILMRGTFANSANLLWPGQFLDVTLTLTVEKDALTVPSQAVQEGPEGKIIFLVGKDNKVEIRPVKVKRVVGISAVLGGEVKAGDKVVVDGHLLLYPGAAVMEKKIPSTRESLKAQQQDAAQDSQEKKEKQAKKQSKSETAQEGKQKK